MATMPTSAAPGFAWWAKQGAIAGIVFALFEMIMAAALKGAFFGPLRMISGIALGKEALQPSYGLATAVSVGSTVHMIDAIVFGVFFGLIMAAVPMLARSTATLVGATSVYGLVLWLVNFYLIAPAVGWNWFPAMTNPVVQFCFGTVLGYFLTRALTPQRAR
jgi:hypothetical protein